MLGIKIKSVIDLIMVEMTINNNKGFKMETTYKIDDMLMTYEQIAKRIRVKAFKTLTIEKGYSNNKYSVRVWDAVSHIWVSSEEAAIEIFLNEVKESK